MRGSALATIAVLTLCVPLNAQPPLPIDTASLLQRMRSSIEDERRDAVMELQWAFQRNAEPADSATTVEVLNRMLSIHLAGAYPWTDLEGIRHQIALLPEQPDPPEPALLADQNLPPAIREAWRNRVRLVPDSMLSEASRESPVYGLDPVEWLGPFLRIGIYVRQTRGARFNITRAQAFVVRTADGLRLVSARYEHAHGDPGPASQIDTAGILGALRSDSFDSRRAAVRMLWGFRDSGEPADSTASEGLVGRLLAIELEGAEPWPAIVDGPNWFQWKNWLGGMIRGSPPLSDRALPSALREAWQDRIRIIPDSARYGEHSDTFVYVLNPVRRFGPFAWVGINLTRTRPRAQGAGIFLTLIETTQGWRVVHAMTEVSAP